MREHQLAEAGARYGGEAVMHGMEGNPACASSRKSPSALLCRSPLYFWCAQAGAATVSSCCKTVPPLSSFTPIPRASSPFSSTPCSPFLPLFPSTMAAVAATDTGEGNEALQTVAPKAPVTYERPISTKGLGIPKPHVPRALHAVDADHPNGTPGYNHNGYSVLQQHVAFFDRNQDGIIYPWETFAGFRAIGFNLIISFLGMVIINGAFSYSTLESWIPSLLFPIYIKNIHKAKHGSDSEVYDTEGRFVPEKFEELFSKFAKSDKTKLHFDELYALTSANKNAVDPFGWTAEKLEWGITYLLLKDQGGFVSKEQVRGMYDGSLFETIAKQREQSMIHKKKV